MFEGMRSEIRASATPRCRSMEEFDDYCFSVAGTVGHFLSKVLIFCFKVLFKNNTLLLTSET